MSSSSTRPLTVLVFRGAGTEAAALTEWIGPHARIETADSIEDAVRTLRNAPIDVVIADANYFRPLDSFHLPQHADVLVESAALGTCITDEKGELVWASPRMLELPDEVRGRVRDACAEAGMWARQWDPSKPAHQYVRPISIEAGGELYEVNVTPIVELGSKVQRVAAMVWSATRARRLQQRIDAIDKAAEELVSLDDEQISRLDVQQRLDLLEQKVIRYTRELLHFDNFTVHLLDKKTNKLELVLSSGMPSRVHEIPIYAVADGNGVCGWVAATGRSYICPDVSQDQRYITGMEGAQSCLSVPLVLHDEVIGVFNIESLKPSAFTEDDRQFAEIFARHIAMALHILNLLVTERHQTTGQLASDVMGEITGPLNDLLTEISGLVEDYIGHDELRRRLNQVSDNAVRVREAIREMTTHRPGLLNRYRATGAVRHDPVLEGRTILVADDEEVIRETVCDVLRSYGCNVESAADGNGAAELIGRIDFDLVLSDIRMPGRDGYEVFAAAKDRNKDCPVILMTGFGYDPNHSIVRARREGLSAVLFKPFKVEQLLGEIRTAIRAAQRQT